MRRLFLSIGLLAALAATNVPASGAALYNSLGEIGPEPDVLPPPAEAGLVDGKLFVFHKNSFLGGLGYHKFAAAAGKQHVSGAALPADLSGYACVILSVNLALPQADVDAIAAYAKAGGNVLAIAEWDAIPQPKQVMNRVAEAAGSGVRVKGGAHDLGFHTTDRIAPSTLTLGVSSLRYAAAAEVTLGGLGFPMVKENDGAVTIVAAEQVGLGYLVMAGDFNMWSDYDGGGYAAHSNGALANLVCNGVAAVGVPGGVL